MFKRYPILKQSAIYLFSNATVAAIPILLLPLVTTKLTPEEYGVWTSYLLISNLVLPFIGLGSDSGLNTFYFKMKPEEYQSYLSSVLVIILLTSGFFITIFWAANGLLEQWFQVPQNRIYLAAIYLLLFQLCEVLLIQLRLLNKAVLYGLFKLGRVSLELCVMLLLFFKTNLKWEVLLIAQLFSFFMFTCFALMMLYRLGLLKFSFNLKHLRQAILFGVPIIPHVLGTIAIGMSDRWFILHYYGLKEMALYSVGLQLGMVMALLQNSFNQAWVPWLFNKLSFLTHVEKLKIVKLSYLYMGALLLIALFLSLVMPYILRFLVSSEYRGAEIFIFWVLLGYAFNGMYKIVVNYLFYIEQTKIIGAITIATALLNIILNYILINLNGAIGACQATCIAFLLQFIFIWIYSDRKFPMPWGLK